MTKQELRKAMREAKTKYSRQQLGEMSRSVCNNIISNSLWRDASTVLLYYPLPDEVNVTPLIAEGRAEGKTILLPVVVGDDLAIRVYEGEQSLVTGAFGIKEPTGREYTDYASIDLVMVPGLAFNRDGHRLGRGKGYYDRLLPRLPNAHRIGVCFPFQLVDRVPSETHDQSVDSFV